MNFKMTIDQLFEYRRVLSEEITKAKLANDARRVSQLEGRIAFILTMLDASLLATVEENIAIIQRVAPPSFFDESMLRAIMPGVVIPKAIETTLQINFEEQQSTPGLSEEFETIKRLMSSNFVKNIPKAVSLLMKQQPDLFPSDAWKVIKHDICKDVRMISNWDRHLAATFAKHGPIVAFSKAKARLPKWETGEIARLLNLAIEDHMKDSKTPFSEAREIESMMGFLNVKENKWKADERSMEVVREFTGIERPEKEIGRIVANLIPEMRQKIEYKTGRKAYVEKGYGA